MATQPNFNTQTFGDFVELADIIWFQESELVDMSAKNSGMFINRPWPAGTGDDRNFKEFDTNQYARNKNEGDSAAQSVIQMGYNKHASLVRRAENVTLTWEMRNRNKYDEAIAQITALPEKIAGRRDLDLSHRFAFATAASYSDMDGLSVDTTVGDGLSLGNAAHTLKASALTYRNILTGNPAFSQTALEAMEKQAVENTLDHFGAKKTVPFDILWTTDNPATINLVRKLLQSTAEVAATNEGVVNVYKAKYKHVILPRLATDKNGAVDATKATYWGIASSKMSSAYLADEQEPTMIKPRLNGMELTSDNAEDVNTDDVTWRGRGSYSICIVGAKWFQMSKGDAS